MSQEIVERVRVKYPTPLGATHGACLIEIAQTLGGGAGLLLKDYGVFVVLPNGVKVSQDIICYPNGRIFDCLGDGEGAAVPAWSEAHGSPIDPARYYAVSAVPVPEPTPPAPPAPVACKAVETAGEVLDALHEMRLEQDKRHETLLLILARLENDNRKSRPVTVSGWRTGTLKGDVGGVS
jgi:hypothetical protein